MRWLRQPVRGIGRDKGTAVGCSRHPKHPESRINFPPHLNVIEPQMNNTKPNERIRPGGCVDRRLHIQACKFHVQAVRVACPRSLPCLTCIGCCAKSSEPGGFDSSILCCSSSGAGDFGGLSSIAARAGQGARRATRVGPLDIGCSW